MRRSTAFACSTIPTVVKNFKNCGVSRARCAGRNRRHRADLPRQAIPTAKRPRTSQAAEKVLMAIRPYVRYINSSQVHRGSRQRRDLPGAGLERRRRPGARRARAKRGKGINIKYNIPKEGAVMFFDMLAIPADAPHPQQCAPVHRLPAARPRWRRRIPALVHYAIEQRRRLSADRSGVSTTIAASIRPPADAAHLVPNLPRTAGLHAPADAHVDPLQDRTMTWRTRSKTPSHGSIRTRRPTFASRTSPSASATFVAVNNVSLNVERGRDLLPARRLRLRQDDAAAHAGRLRDSPAPAGLHRRPGHGRRCRPTSGRST